MAGTEHIEYNGVQYPIRYIPLKFDEDGDVEFVKVAGESLNKVLEPHEGTEGNIDSDVYFYVPDDLISVEELKLCEFVAEQTEAFVPTAEELEDLEG